MLHHIKPIQNYDRQTAILLSFILGFLGIHLWYLKKPWWQVLAYIFSAIVGAIGFLILANNDWGFGYAWLPAALGVANLLCAWFSCLFFALAPKWRWLAYTQQKKSTPNDEVQANGVFIAIICLMISMGGLMAFLALLFQRYYESVLAV